MACPDYEALIAGWLERQLPPGEASRVAGHVEGCRECAEFARQWRAVDAGLSRVLRPRLLSAGFRQRLWQRIEREGLAGGPANREELKQRAQAEYERGLARMRRRVWSLGAALDALGLGLLVAATATAAVVHAPKLLQALPPELQGRLISPLWLGAVLGAAVLVLGALAVCRRPGRLGSWL